ncbi:transposase [Streptomyces sp. NPDC102476]|uniref:transposase n=1 Tax=Streptomyces sp. NPDC102476 TaxID=3366181 RepID=UPI003819FE03
MPAGLPLPRFDGGRLVPAADGSPWLHLDAPCSAERLFLYGRAKTASQFIPGRPYSFAAVPEPGATSWTPILDAVRLGPTDDATAVTAAQLRGVVERLVAAGQWQAGDPDIVIVSDAGYDVTRLAWVLRDLPVEMVGRVRSDRVMRPPKPRERTPSTADRPSMARNSASPSRRWPEPAITTITDTTNTAKPKARRDRRSAYDRCMIEKLFLLPPLRIRHTARFARPLRERAAGLPGPRRPLVQPRLRAGRPASRRAREVPPDRGTPAARIHSSASRSGRRQADAQGGDGPVLTRSGDSVTCTGCQFGSSRWARSWAMAPVRSPM